jgi:non-specific serine/threonine protein kinase
MESVRDALADRPAPKANEGSLFLRQNDYWTIRHRGRTACLKATRGLQCLALLLRHPGREFHVSELLASVVEAPVAAQDGCPRLDAQAKAEYQRRLDDLRHELNEAEQFNDPARMTQAQDEMSAIAHHLASAVGLGGRDRKTSSEAERARCAVTKRIKQSIQKIAEAIPDLGHHLTVSIKTGYFCSYSPHQDRPVAWKFGFAFDR